MEAQSDHFYNQLVVATDKVNEGNKVNLRLTNNIKTKNVLLLGLSIITGILIIK